MRAYVEGGDGTIPIRGKLIGKIFMDPRRSRLASILTTMFCKFCNSTRVLYISLGAHSEGQAVLRGVKGDLPNTEITPFGDAVELSVCMDCLKLQLDGPMAPCELEISWTDQVSQVINTPLLLSDGSTVTCTRAFVDNEEETFFWNGTEWRTITGFYDPDVETFNRMWPVARPSNISNQCWAHINLLYDIPEGLSIVPPETLTIGEYKGWPGPKPDGSWYLGY
jgi:hypothetical protein